MISAKYKNVGNTLSFFFFYPSVRHLSQCGAHVPRRNCPKEPPGIPGPGSKHLHLSGCLFCPGPWPSRAPGRGKCYTFTFWMKRVRAPNEMQSLRKVSWRNGKSTIFYPTVVLPLVYISKWIQLPWSPICFSMLPASASSSQSLLFPNVSARQAVYSLCNAYVPVS